MNSKRIVSGDLVGEDTRLTLDELCQRCHLEVREVRMLIEEGVVEPRGQHDGEWHFSLRSVRRVRTAVRLQRDLGVNAAGAALAVELLERIAELERRLR